MSIPSISTALIVAALVPAGASAGGPGGGVALFKCSADGSAAAKLPAVVKLVGNWAIRDGQYGVDWSNGPTHSCTGIVRSDAGHILVDRVRNEVRGSIQRIVPGNPENL